MECELKKGGEGGGETESLIAILEEEVKAATDLLLLTNFSACLEICHHVVTSINSCEESDPDTVDRLAKVREAATVIGIQALAEQGAWKEVIPFVEQTYTHMAACPASIMQMCLLLHSHVREYLVCHSLIDSWLDWDDHRHLPESGAIVTTYVTNVLIPLSAFNLIPQIVERCTVLSSEERQALLSPRAGCSPQAGQGRLCLAPDDATAMENTTAVKPDARPCAGKDDGNKHKGFRIISVYLHLTKKLWRSLAKRGWCQYLRRASKLFFLLSFILLALLHVQTGEGILLWRSIHRCDGELQSCNGSVEISGGSFVQHVDTTTTQTPVTLRSCSFME